MSPASVGGGHHLNSVGEKSPIEFATLRVSCFDKSKALNLILLFSEIVL